MKTNITKSNKGFTIIEVLIVLAIVGVIMAIIFLAVPALQRNSRNTQRRADVNSLAAAFNEWQSANSATSAPTGWASNQLTGAAGSTAVSANVSYYTGVTVAAVASPPQTALTSDTVRIVTGARCNGTAVQAGAARQAAIQFVTETAASATTAQCQDV